MNEKQVIENYQGTWRIPLPLLIGVFGLAFISPFYFLERHQPPAATAIKEVPSAPTEQTEAGLAVFGDLAPEEQRSFWDFDFGFDSDGVSNSFTDFFLNYTALGWVVSNVDEEDVESSFEELGDGAESLELKAKKSMGNKRR